MEKAKRTVRRARWRRRLILIIILGVGAFLLFDINLKPVILNMAEAQARVMAVKAANKAVYEVMRDDVDYEHLMRIVMDGNGRVAMIQANTLRMNELSTRTALAAQQNLETIAATGIRVPLGAALGIRVLAGSGPYLTVRIVPMGAVSTEFVSTFTSAGINQTRHTIYLRIHTTVRMIIPTGADTASVSAQAPIAESIIVGQVPESFVNVADEEQMLNVLPDD